MKDPVYPAGRDPAATADPRLDRAQGGGRPDRPHWVFCGQGTAPQPLAHRTFRKAGSLFSGRPRKTPAKHQV